MARNSRRYTPPSKNGVAAATRGGKLLGQPKDRVQSDVVMVDALVNADLAGAIKLASQFVMTPDGKAAVLSDDGDVMVPGNPEAAQMLANAIGVCVEAAKHYAIYNQSTNQPTPTKRNNQ